MCGARCIDFTSDPANCGGCGHACTGVPNANGHCHAGACALLCRPGHADCEGWQECAVDRCSPLYDSTFWTKNATNMYTVMGPDGSVFITGVLSAATDFAPLANVKLSPTAGARTAFVLKLKRDRTVVWSYRFGGTTADDKVLIEGVLPLADGAIVVNGTASGTVTLAPGVTRNAGPMMAMGYVLKLDNAGRPGFAQATQPRPTSVNPKSDTSFHAPAVASDGTLYLGAALNGQIDLNPDGGGDVVDTGKDWWHAIVKYSANGVYQGKLILFKQNARIAYITVLASGDFLVAGSYTGSLLIGPSPKTTAWFTSFVLTLDHALGFKDVQTWPASQYSDLLTAFTVAADGSYFVGMLAYGPVDLDPGPATDLRPHTGTFSPMIVKMDAAGHYAWGYSPHVAGLPWDLVAMADGGVLVAMTFSTVGNVGPTGGDSRNPANGPILVTRLGPNREYRWGMNIGSKVSDLGLRADAQGFYLSGNLSVDQGDYDPRAAVTSTIVIGAAESGSFVSHYSF